MSDYVAKIMVDGEEFINCEKGDNYLRAFQQTVAFVGGEVALMVWKPRYGAYLREKLSMTAPIHDSSLFQ